MVGGGAGWVMHGLEGGGLERRVRAEAVTVVNVVM